MSQPVQPTPGEAKPARAADRSPSFVLGVLRVLKRQPVLFISLAYLLVSFLGLWSSYWFYRRFDLPILEFLQSSDYFVAGLRRPEYLLVLVYAVLVMWISTIATRWNERNPEGAQAFRERHRWGKYVVPAPDSWASLRGARSETLLVIGFLLLAVWQLYWLNAGRADAVHAGRGGQRVQVTLLNGGSLPGDVRLLGTSSAYVFLWWPVEQHTRVLPITAVASLKLAERKAAIAPAPAPSPQKAEARPDPARP